jgi:hypothetical protein
VKPFTQTDCRGTHIEMAVDIQTDTGDGMKMGGSDVKPFDYGLVGISDRTLEMHIKLYEDM